MLKFGFKIRLHRIVAEAACRAIALATAGRWMVMFLVASVAFVPVEARVNVTGNYGNNQLIKAARCGNSWKVRMLCALGADVNAQNSAHVSALSEAILQRHIDVVRILINAGADVNASISYGGENQPLLMQALWCLLLPRYSGGAVNSNQNQRSQAILQLLLDAGADVHVVSACGDTVLMQVAHWGQDHEVVNMLLKAGADVNAVNNKHEMFINCEQPSPFKAPGRSVLMEAVLGHDEETVKLLLAAGADVNKANIQGATPLMRAAAYRSSPVMKLVLAAGADCNAATNDGETALMYAVSTRGLKRLIPNDVRYAAGCLRDKCVYTVQMLLDAGAAVNAADKNGRTALMYAAAFRHADAVRVLLAAGADATLRDKHGKTALDILHDEESIKAIFFAGNWAEWGAQFLMTIWSAGTNESVDTVSVQVQEIETMLKETIVGQEVKTPAVAA